MNIAEMLAIAGRKMLGKTKVKRGDAKRVLSIAKQCKQGTASGRDIAWAKNQAAYFLPRQGH